MAVAWCAMNTGRPRIGICGMSWLPLSIRHVAAGLRAYRIVKYGSPKSHRFSEAILVVRSEPKKTDGEPTPRASIWLPTIPPHCLCLLGGDSRGGTYILRIRVGEPLEMPFGRFKRGKLISVVPGDYCYIGSALSEKGATCLAKRLVRHASRLGHNPAHSIRKAMITELPRCGLADGDLEPMNPKKPKWNVDHLLDKACVDLVTAFVIRWPLPLECDVADWLVADQATVVFEPGLGANDHRGGTHLMRVEAGEPWWEKLPARLDERFLNGTTR